MNSNQNDTNLDITSPDALATLESPLDATTEKVPPGPSNDNATSGGTLDTTPLVARADVVRYLRGALQRYGVAPQDMADAIAQVQVDAIEAARAGRMPASIEEWRALGVTIAVRWAIDRLREAEVRDKYDAGLCDDPDVYLRPTLHWEERDPVDTKRYLAILRELFDSGQMPEHGAEILWGEAEEVPHAETASELGISETAVRGRLFRMRVAFRAKLASLGLLTFVLLLLLELLASVGGTGRSPQEEPVDPAPPVRVLPGHGVVAPPATNSTAPVKRNRVLPD
jgi:DNA-directed RNA polymerase specialized sigma24 family protein